MGDQGNGILTIHAASLLGPAGRQQQVRCRLGLSERPPELLGTKNSKAADAWPTPPGHAPLVIVRKRSCPAVSHICSLTHLPSISTFFILKSMLQRTKSVKRGHWRQGSSAAHCRHSACVAGAYRRRTRWW